MYKAAKSYSKDKNGNSWYLTELFSGCGCKLLDKIDGKTDLDMSNDQDKAKAMNVCTPLATVIDKVGSLFSKGRYYVTDKDGNELTIHDDIRNLLRHPNVLQTGKQFSKQIEMSLKLFGYCPIYQLRAIKSAFPTQLWIIPPELFHVISTGKLFKQNKLSGIIKNAYIQWGNEKIEVEPHEYFIIYDSEAVICGENNEIEFRSVTDSLSFPVSNWIAQMVASNTLIVNGGPKGIIYNNDTSEFGNAALSSTEQEELNNKFKNKYGLVGKMYSILVTKAKLGWLPLNYDSNQLKLHEEDTRCSNKIANAIGINPNVFNSDSKYENQEAAERKAYQGLVIPDSELVSEALTMNLCPEGVFIKMDYSHVECLQKDRKESASALSLISNALSKLVDGDLITKDEARIELATYLEINPDKPKGEFKQKDNDDE